VPRVEQPVTLMQVHELMLKERPRKGAPRSEWLAHYRRGAGLYEEVADIDRGHHHEAMYWAGWERRKAGKLTKNPQIGPDQEG